MPDYPGTPAQQRLLQAIAACYASDPRILAVGVFGSLGCGSWDAFSDLDLDIVVADDAELDVPAEVRRLCTSLAAIGEEAAVILPDGPDAADVVLRSLREFSIRYHTLSTTSPHIVGSLRLLAGRLDLDAIRAAGLANAQPPARSVAELAGALVRYAVEVRVALGRRRPWMALELLHRVRALLMELYARTRGLERPLQAFQAHAPAALQAQLAETVAPCDLAAIRQAFARLLALLEEDLTAWTDGQLTLTKDQRAVLRAVQHDEAP